jgi:hypothetical protein
LATGPAGIPGRVVSAEFCGEHLQLLVKIDSLETPVVLRVPRQIGELLQATRPGAAIQLEINPDDVPVVPLHPLIKESLHAQQCLT